MTESVPVRTFRAQVAAFLRRAEGGERIVVTVAGRPVAQLGPLDPGTGVPTIPDLAARGLVTPARRSDRPPPDVRLDPWPGTRLDRLVAEVRS
ncbi:type II toxin-antitoxin system prevent-host-death family antitoxin [Iamia sp.]|jgi:prevent-host-death family protein|uniref:type II toxin-antitoxin system Phd/YefM family antitoxin n=1 Tax=Iamia sp. TaxID=2722710 RepID=UPI002BF85E48|nr:type II toxin-antitoxin system prevent-host-death family antitoxin [Iamia sp.]HXH58206.1 type II toxin-antitoxin system prevent-host-death family antitoxin [Iamia sp.]